MTDILFEAVGRVISDPLPLYGIHDIFCYQSSYASGGMQLPMANPSLKEKGERGHVVGYYRESQIILLGGNKNQRKGSLTIDLLPNITLHTYHAGLGSRSRHMGQCEAFQLRVNIQFRIACHAYNAYSSVAYSS